MSLEFFREYGKGMLEQGMSLPYIAHYFGNKVYEWYYTEYTHNLKEA